MSAFSTSIAAALFVVGASAIAHDQTARPGEMTKAEVWVKNGRQEAIPVSLEPANLPRGLPVRVLNGDETAIQPLRVRVIPPTWEYRTIIVQPNDDPARQLTTEGKAGWETTGIAWPGQNGALVLLIKRAQ